MGIIDGWMDGIRIYRGTASDISYYVLLSYEKRRTYEKVQSQFWKYAGNTAEESQFKWFKELLTLDDYKFLKSLGVAIASEWYVGGL